MAITRVDPIGVIGDNGFFSNNENASDTSLGGGTFNGSLLLAGDILVAAIATDNLNATTPTFSIDSNPSQIASWSIVAQAARNATGNAGTATACFIGVLASNGASSMTRPTFTMSGAVTAKAMVVFAIRGASTTQRGTVQTANGASTTPSVVSASASIGDIVIGWAAVEQNAAPTADSDTSNGSWSAQMTTNSTGGGSAANQAVAAQTKIVTGAGTQTYNLTTANTDWIAHAFVLQPADEGRPWKKGDYVRKSGLFVPTPRTLSAPVGI